MPGLAENVLNLAGLRKSRDEALANLAEPLRLTLAAPNGPNPGALRMLTYVPPGLPPGAPLVVVLHGCTQNAAAYDYGSGWSTLAERHGFALLFPEQVRANNANLCFNWFNPEDVGRRQGEAESIRQMTLQMVATHLLDPRRVFVTGLSAGGAMTAAMLATAPELFAGGAIIAGLPYGAAHSVMDALGAMRTVRARSGAEWAGLVRAASPHAGPWPTVQVWHGADDDTVSPANAEALVQQWAGVLGLALRPDAEDVVDGARHETWRRAGHPVLERWTVPRLGHGTPILADPADPDRGVGIPGPHMLAAGISSTWHLARSWGLLTQPARTAVSRPQSTRPGPAVTPLVTPVLTAASTVVAKPLAAASAVIDKAMRAAGLVK